LKYKKKEDINKTNRKMHKRIEEGRLVQVKRYKYQITVSDLLMVNAGNSDLMIKI
jgi:hypothetical protein